MDKSKTSTVTYNPAGYLEVNFVGYSTYQSIDELRRQCEQQVEDMRMRHERLLGLVDVNAQTGFDPGSSRAAFQALSDIPYEKVAIVADNKIFANMADMIIAAIGKKDSTRFFTTREEAVPWLMMKDPLEG